MIYPIEEFSDAVKRHLEMFIPYPSHLVHERVMGMDRFTLTFEPSKNTLQINDAERITGAGPAILKWVDGIIQDYISGYERFAIPKESPKVYSKYKFKVMRDLPDGTIYVNDATYKKMCEDHIDISIRGNDGKKY